jgi:hypothetical protein
MPGPAPPPCRPPGAQVPGGNPGDRPLPVSFPVRYDVSGMAWWLLYGRVMISMPCPAGSMKYSPRPPW